MSRVIVLLAFLACWLTGCAPFPPNRQANAEPAPGCAAVFESARPAQAAQTAGSDSDRAENEPRLDYGTPCWQAAHEYTPAYDLYFVEFDDHGWLSSPASESLRIKWVMQRLNALSEQGGGTPLNLIVYTHGWHHTAAPDDRNVNAFRNLLARAARLEQRMSARPGNGAAGRQRKVVGVYIGWRGDSVLGPGIRHSSIWDRKLAAEEVAQGAAQELFARLHNFYLAHACHFSEASDAKIAGKSAAAAEAQQCNDVHMLTIGHSFGALITYRALAGRLIANVAESQAPGDRADVPPYAHSFGDLVVLINPAFEGVHFEALARAAAERAYRSDAPGQGRHGAQLPIMIVLQSEGDWATRRFFPAFRTFTTIFSPSRGAAQSDASRNSVGWTDRYVTHRLDLESAADANCNLDCRLEHEHAWSKAQQQLRYRGFGEPKLPLTGGQVLKRCAVDDKGRLACGDELGAGFVRDPRGLERPPFMPIWVVRTDPRIIKDHTDFLNPNLIVFIRQMYYTVLAESLADPRD